jgi:3-oxoacyl-[acyl-carrier-protein] synthase-3
MTNADLMKLVDTSDEWIITRTGINERRIASDEQATSDLVYPAAVRALEAAGTSADELDGIIMATVTPDHILPSTACILQKRLKNSRAFCFDLQAACTGMLYALEVAHSMILANKRYKKILVLAAEKLSYVTDWSDRNTCVLFGDGASALVLERTEGEDSILATSLHADGNYTDILKIEAGGSRMPMTAELIGSGRNCIQMEGREVFKLAANAMADSCKDVLDMVGMTNSDVNWLVPHQANLRIMNMVAQRLDIGSERVYVNVNRYGNTSAATIGLCLDEMIRGGMIKRGQIVLMTAFGGGLTWGSSIIRY